MPAGEPVWRLAENAGIPASALSTPGSFLPRQTVKRFTKEVVGKTGDNLLFYDIAPEGFLSFRNAVDSQILGRGVTVFKKLNRLVEIASKASSVLKWSIRIDSELIWIIRSANEPIDAELWFFEQFAIGVFEIAISDAVGDQVLPKFIRLRSAPEPHQVPKHWREIHVSKRQAVSGIAYETKILGASQPKSMAGIRLDFGERFDAEKLSSLTDAIFLYDKGWGHGLETAAEAFGVGRRTFQRRLAELGFTYSEMVEEVRFRNALELIQRGDITMSEVAVDAGFNSTSNFSRAFRRRFGVTPSKYFALKAEDS
jgi:AraC-like DNA-binding protein